MKHIVQTISIRYSAVEDRLELVCRCDDKAHQLWLTQRLWKQLASALINWLVDSGVAGSEAGRFMRESFPESLASSPSLSSAVEQPTGGPLPNETAESSSDLSGSQLPDSSSIETMNWLCTTAHLSLSGQQVRIKLESVRSEDVYVLTMSALEAGHFLMAQHKVLREAGWPLHWPMWLHEDTHLVSDHDSSLLH